MKTFRLIPPIVFYTVPLIAVAWWPSGRERLFRGRTAAVWESGAAPGADGGKSSATRSSVPDADGRFPLPPVLTQWLVNNNPEPDYAAAFAWAGSASPERQEEFFSMTLSNWKHHDPAAAAAAVDALPVSGERKTRLLNQLK